MSSQEKGCKKPAKEYAEEEKPVSAEEEEISELKDRVLELEGRIQDQDYTILRQRADVENYRKQLDKEKEEFAKCANRDIISDLLEVADNFERALPVLREKDPESAKGMEIVYKQLMKTLEKYGLCGIDALGKKFNPDYHEAFLQEETEGPEGMVLEELQKGYRLKDKVLRHSKVKVSKKSN